MGKNTLYSVSTRNQSKIEPPFLFVSIIILGTLQLEFHKWRVISNAASSPILQITSSALLKSVQLQASHILFWKQDILMERADRQANNR